VPICSIPRGAGSGGYHAGTGFPADTVAAKRLSGCKDTVFKSIVRSYARKKNPTLQKPEIQSLARFLEAASAGNGKTRAIVHFFLDKWA